MRETISFLLFGEIDLFFYCGRLIEDILQQLSIEPQLPGINDLYRFFQHITVGIGRKDSAHSP